MNISATVKKLVNRYGTCDPFRICKELEIIVIFGDLGNETRGLIKKYKRSYIICINDQLSEPDQLQTCAHELGHYALHKQVNTLFMKTCTYLKTDKYEIQANEFAALLLQDILE